MSEIYSYSVSNDFPGGQVNLSRFNDEIRRSSIATAIERIDQTGDAIDVVFASSLTASEKTTLDGDISSPAGGLIASHDSTPFDDKLFPKEVVLGDRTDYHTLSSPVTGEIQYTKVIAGQGTYSKIQLWIDSGAGQDVDVIGGVYFDSNGVPGNKAVEGSINLQTAGNESFVQILLDSSFEQYVVTPLWIAIVFNADTPVLVSTDILISDFHPVFFEQTPDSLLPISASPASGSGSLLYAGLIE